MNSNISKHLKILVIITAFACLYFLFQHLGFTPNKYVFIQIFVVLFFITIVTVLLLRIEVLNKNLITSLANLSSANTKIEKKIEKLSTQVQKFETQLITTTNTFHSKPSRPNKSELDKKDNLSSFFEIQSELSEPTNHKKVVNDDKESEPLTWDLILKALNFPEDKNDHLGFLALNTARKNNSISELLRVSEDLLKLIAQDGIYLDDLKIEPPEVKSWLNFLRPDQNHTNIRLNCVGIDREINKLKSRIKSDAIFRDTSLMLMRRFDLLLRDRFETASDNQIFKIAETRSGKAFLIVGKLSDSC